MMKIEISTKAVLSVLGTIALGVASWAVLGLIEHGNRLTRLEDSDANDARQDSELVEIRATMRDLIRLTAELAGHAHPTGGSESVVRPPALPDVGAGPEDVEPGAAPLEPEYGEFRMEQADLESILRGRGIAPAEKRSSDQ